MPAFTTRSHPNTRTITLALFAGLSLALAACGGGGATDPASASVAASVAAPVTAPIVAPAAAPDRAAADVTFTQTSFAEGVSVDPATGSLYIGTGGDANPKLGYRDIQSILAMSATKVNDPNGTDWTYNTAKNWNGGGMHTSHDYGFGKVDARAAVRLAETWYDTSTAWNEQSKTARSGTLNAAIPDGAGVLSRTLTNCANSVWSIAV